MDFWLAFKVSTELIVAQQDTESPTVPPQVGVMWVCVGRGKWERAWDGESESTKKKSKKVRVSFIIAEDVYGEAAAGVDTLATVAARPQLLRVLSLHHVPTEYTRQPQVCPHHPGPHQSQPGGCQNLSGIPSS